MDAMETFGNNRIALVQGNMATLEADAVVNAANPDLTGCFEEGCDCVDHAIHAAAGSALREACEKQMQMIRKKLGDEYRQPIGIPMMTDAFDLPARKILHVVGPNVNGTLTDLHKEQLSLCYRNTLMLCESRGLKRVAFCCISTGNNHFPRREAAEIAVRTVKACLEEHPAIETVIFNTFLDEDFRIYRELLEKEAG